MSFESVFVTVGTTKFNKLIDSVTNENTLKVLKTIGCKRLTIQIGAGENIPEVFDRQISLEYYRYRDSISDNILDSDLVISHAGAGTCMDVLEKGKPLITVINDDLMHNHQTELAEKLSNEGYSIYCTCISLTEAIKNASFKNFKPFKYTYNRTCALFIENFFNSNKES